MSYDDFGGFDFILDRVPVPRARMGDVGTLGELGEEAADGAWLVVDAGTFDQSALGVENGEDGVPLECIASDLIMR